MRSSVFADIDLSALRHNLAVVRAHAPHSRVMAVVKSLAYGHGCIPIAQALQGQADALAVARFEEAVALREAGISGALVVLEGPACAAQLDVAAELDLQLTLHHASQLPLLRSYRGAPLACWLKCDTGMHRLGFVPQELAGLHAELCALPGVASVDLMTHLACADDRDDATTQAQLAAFAQAAEGLQAQRSIANSAGILAWPDSHADWVRPGLMLYGASPMLGQDAGAFDLRPVMTLQAPLIAIKPLAAGEAVGYGATWRAPRDLPLGVVGIGYGDGYPRHIGAAAQVLINRQRAPVVGRVSMDMITVDLSGIEAQVGDSVTLWGEGLSADEVARWADTIPYTLFCGVSARVERRYKD